jgi:3-hydroxybutyryl-CoA dehydrogenase
VVRSEFTRDDVFEQAFQWILAAGKRPVKVHRDVTGFVGNRLQLALWREAIHLIEDGVCDGETIDVVVKNSFGMRMAALGPIENADLIGLELTRSIQEVMFPELHCDKQPSKLLDQLIGAGHLGMATGRGLRTWTPEEASAVKERLAVHLLSG